MERRSEKGVHPPSCTESPISFTTSSQESGAAVGALEREIPPRTGPELLGALRPFTKEARGRSWWYFLSTALLVIVALAGTVWGGPLPVRAGISLVAGLLIVRLFVIYHDHQHRALLEGSRLAHGMMFVFGIYSLAPMSIWRSSHNHHHHHNCRLKSSHIGSYPIMTRERYLNSSRGDRIRYLAMRHPLTILFGYVSVFLVGMCLAPFVRNPRRHWDAMLALGVHAALWAVYHAVGGWEMVLLSLVLPQFVASAAGSYLFYAQHNFPGVHHHQDDGWTYEGAALESSSYMRMHPVMAWFTGNIGYHHIHHLDPRIPFYRLPEAMRAVGELRNARTTSLAPREIARCLRLKVWDPDAGRMIGLSQVRASRKSGGR